MAQATPKKVERRPLGVHVGLAVREGILIVLLAASGYLLTALVDYNPSDPGWSHTGIGLRVTNIAGRAGAWFADVFFYLFGWLAFLAPVIVAYSGWLVFRGREGTGDLDLRTLAVRWAGFFLTLGSGCGLAALHFVTQRLPLDAGGVLGEVIADGFLPVFGLIGTTIFLLALFLAGVTLLTGLSWLSVMDGIGRLLLGGIGGVRNAIEAWRDRKAGQSASEAREEVVRVEREKIDARIKPRIEPVIAKPVESRRAARERQMSLPVGPAAGDTIPPLALLDEAKPHVGGYSQAALEAMSRQVEMKLKDFGIEVEVVAVHPGPVITRFELQPAAGVKVSRITTLVKDLARALSVVSVRIVEVIPGKSTVGLEIPNEQRELIVLSEILGSRVFDEAGSVLTLALGKDIGGMPVVADLARMPHLLVAGTTGSGKSVGLNAMLLSLLYKATPEQVRLILIDPKMLELSVYADIPHLLAPVVTDMKDAANALRWCVAEMERRYRMMSFLGVRNIAGCNRKIREAEEQGAPLRDPLHDPARALNPEAPAPNLSPLPYIVVVVDEFADMMMVVGKKVEELIARLAQKARASGIHLILATQRPSVDVITGLIKANIPARIAFQVSSRVDSRTILDQMGAEQLLGHGDMLYMPPGTAHPMRVHGAFVSDAEVHRVVEHLRGLGEPAYDDEVLSEPEGNGDYVPGLEPVDVGQEADPLYDQAVAIVLETRKASISYVQRRLKIGYNRAARMIEEMQRTGIVGPAETNGNREVLAPPPPED